MLDAVGDDSQYDQSMLCQRSCDLAFCPKKGSHRHCVVIQAGSYLADDRTVPSLQHLRT